MINWELIDTQTAYDDHIIGGDRLGIIDRAVRTIKNILMKYVYSHTNYKIKELIQDIVENYNETPHVGIDNMRPNDIFSSKDLRYKVFMKNLEWNQKIDNFLDLNIDDTVRILEDKGKYGKERPQFSKDIYEISAFKGNKLKVRDSDGDEVRRVLKPYEVQKIDVEKVEGMAKKNATTQINRNKKIIKTVRTLKQEGIDQSNIVRGSRRKRRAKTSEN